VLRPSPNHTRNAACGRLSQGANQLFDSPKTSLTTSLTLYPSLTDTGRVRADLDVALRHELVADLFFELNFYGSHDSRPPENGEKSDYGFVTGLGYSF
jgi:hypothetical protein